jgi:hypothetical protein
MGGLYSNESIIQALFVTFVLGGGCAILAGRAIAKTWRSMLVVVAAMIPMAMAVRFVHFALFEETLLSGASYIFELAVLLGAACLAFKRTRALQMVGQYYWLYELDGPLRWRLR